MKTENKKLIKRIGSIALLCVTALLALLVLLTIFSKVTGKMILPYSVMWVLSPSMEDTIPMHSYILVKNTSAEKVEEDDIISFYSRNPEIAGSINTHRVVEVIGDHEQFRTRGDNNPAPDVELVYADDIVAKFVCTLPIMTFFGRLYASRTGLVAATSIIICGIGLIISRYLSIREKAEKKAKEDEINRLVQAEVSRLEALAQSENENQPSHNESVTNTDNQSSNNDNSNSDNS